MRTSIRLVLFALVIPVLASAQSSPVEIGQACAPGAAHVRTTL